jgi:hypothetical protein
VGRIGAWYIWETTAAAQHPRPGSPHPSEESALIVLSTYPDGSVLRLSDIAWLELGRPIWTAGCASAEGRPRFWRSSPGPGDHQLRKARANV